MREKSAEELHPRVQVIAEEHGFNPEKEYLLQVIDLMKDRVSKVEDFITQGRFFFEEPREYEERALKKWKDNSAELLQAYLKKIEPLDEAEFEAVTLKDKIKEVIKAHDVGFGPLMMPLRLAVSGMGHGPDLTPSLELVGKDATVRRIETVIKKLG
jgi:glutamyl-tRNA synthetase